MSDVKHFKLPDVGEGLTEAEIVSWKVKPGDTVKVNDVVVEIETAKSLVELPCPFAGTVTELFAGEGDTVDVGVPIIAVDTGAGAAAKGPVAAGPAEVPEVGGGAEDMIPTPAVPSPEGEQAVEPGLIGGPAPGGRTSVLVGYGPRTTEAKRRPRKGVTPTEASPAAAQVGVQQAFSPETMPPPDVPTEVAAPAATATSAVSEEPEASERGTVGGPAKALAKPPVRRLAKDLGIDLSTITPSGPNGSITRADVESHSEAGVAEPAAAAAPAMATGGRETRIPVKGVRKMTAQAMVSSAFTAPHVTEWMTVDATRTMRMVQRLRGHRDFRDVRVSPLLIVARAVCTAMRRTPEVNAAWDEDAQEIVLKHYVNLGIAAATPRGLMVPNIKDAESLSAVALAGAIGELTSTARGGKTQPAEMSGGTFTITNVGVFGVDAGTPILNPGESGILCMGAIRKQPWVVGNTIKPRWITTLALSFDHRVVDGEQGSRFLADVAAIVEDPANALLF
ncbi:MAG: 2-oxo acid dehydrogenase subunit E2 [Nocardioidaceae bacterium]|nr:2-oxo acid dehydrogenase subunit E2 [Nocardioidaceae bacterium]